MSDYFAHDELERVLGGDCLQSPLGTSNVGGEYDPYFQLSPRTRRRITNAGLIVAAPRGERADVLATRIAEHVATIDTTDAALEWYFKMCIRYIAETRQMSHKRRYQRRKQRAAERGFSSYWYHRLARSEGLDPHNPLPTKEGTTP